MTITRNGSTELSCILLFISCFSHFLSVSLGASSLAVGLSICCGFVMLWILLCRRGDNIKLNTTLLILVFTIFLLLLISSIYLMLTYDESKSILSLSLLFIVIAAILISTLIANANFYSLQFALRLCTYFLIVLGFLKLIWTPPLFGYIDANKPVFPFSEESHYALAIGPFLCAYVVNAGKLESIGLTLLVILLSLVYPSLSLLVFGVMAISIIILTVKRGYLYILAVFSALLLALMLAFYLKEHLYFAGRLSFDGSKNLTALVYLQGWQLIFENFSLDNIFGLGFQMLGQSTTKIPDVSGTIYSMTNRQANIEDGGFLAAKIIVEFGIFGVLLSVAYVLFSIRCIYLIRTTRTKNMRCLRSDYARKYVCINALMLGYFVEYFMRGYGYFSPGVTLFLASAFSLVYMKNRNRISFSRVRY